MPDTQQTFAETDTEHEVTITIVVNGRPTTVHTRRVSFEQAVELAFNPVPVGPGVSFTVTYRRAAGAKHEGTLVAGESVEIKEGTIFDVVRSDGG